MDTKAECDQLNLSHETNTNKRQWLRSQVQYRFKIREGSPEEIGRLRMKGSERRQISIRMKTLLRSFWEEFFLLRLCSGGTSLFSRYELKATWCRARSSLNDYKHDVCALLLIHKCTQRNAVTYRYRSFCLNQHTSRVTTRSQTVARITDCPTVYCLTT